MKNEKKTRVNIKTVTIEKRKNGEDKEKNKGKEPGTLQETKQIKKGSN